jgi:hypothetical protein
MKKLLLLPLFLMILFCVTGCGEENPLDDPFIKEINEYSYHNHLQCFREEEKDTYQIDMFQEPETYEVVFGSLTEYHDIYPYDNDGNYLGFDPEKEYCSEYEKDAFDKCKADMYTVGQGNKINKARARYYYRKDVLNSESEDLKEVLETFKELTEKDGYSCEIFYTGE